MAWTLLALHLRMRDISYAERLAQDEHEPRLAQLVQLAALTVLTIECCRARW